ncbi:unnamed protein product [Prorocentrum cordatum]|uniref:Uncharacterized protein n=1 Tax=Prorocentrum cordatum TaxID=2364126 RepID=A0ABN9TC33_9DINO|nr:unnamed protein product [Polarella glacialis]
MVPDKIEHLKESHEFDGKQHELRGIFAMAEGVLQDSKRQDKFDGGDKDNIDDGVTVLGGGAATLCEERAAKQKEQEGAAKRITIFKGSGDSTALADVVQLGRTVQRAVAPPLARARPSAAEAATAQARAPEPSAGGLGAEGGCGLRGAWRAPARPPAPDGRKRDRAPSQGRPTGRRCAGRRCSWSRPRPRPRGGRWSGARRSGGAAVLLRMRRRPSLPSSRPPAGSRRAEAVALGSEPGCGLSGSGGQDRGCSLRLPPCRPTVGGVGASCDGPP